MMHLVTARLLIFLLVFVPVALLRAQPHTASTSGDNPCSAGWAELPRVDPRNPEIICLPELGRMEGTIAHAKKPGKGEEFGKVVVPLGDIDHDQLADWIVVHTRCDTIVPAGYYQSPVEALLYRGVRGGLPLVNSGERIGPTEIGSAAGVLATGDFDADGNIDLVCRFEIYRDTSFGNSGTQVATVVVLWGNANGSYSLADTTRLSCDADGWYGPYGGVSSDFDQDQVQDLFLWSWEGIGLTQGVQMAVPKAFIYHGHHGEQWGHNGISRSADWRLWNAPGCSELSLTDQDGSGVADVAFIQNVDGGTGSVSVLYSRAGELPDTNDLQTIDLKIANGHRAIFSDVTGDQVPELILATGNEQQLKVFVGLKGQRIIEQYGSGHDDPQPGHKQWWGKPWANIWLPGRINDYWYATESQQMFNLGDASRDGIGELWSMSWPYILCYSGGVQLDSLVDAMIDTRPGTGPSLGGIARLGDIDGSGRTTFSVNYDQVPHDAKNPFPGGVKFIQSTAEISQQGVYRDVPQGTGPASITSLQGSRGTSATLRLTAEPNPATDDVHIQWNTSSLHGDAEIIISDALGGEVRRMTVAVSAGEAIWHAKGTFGGVYFITLRSGNASATAKVLLTP